MADKLPFLPENDHVLVRCNQKYMYEAAGEGVNDGMGTGGFESGTVLAVSEHMAYFSAPGWAFDATLMDKDSLARIQEHYKSLIGKEVYWEKYSERGQTQEHEGETYAFVRFTKIVGVKNNEETR